MTFSSILLGIGAGVVSALLFASAATGTLLGVLVLFLLSPLPVAITGLGWGWMTAALAAAAAAGSLALIGSPSAGIMHLMSIGAPTVVLSYLVLLSRPVEPETPGAPPGLQWYPIGRVLGVAAGWAGILALLALMTVGTDYEAVRTTLRRSAERFFELAARGEGPGGTPAFGEGDVAAWTELMTISFAASVGMTWMLLSSLNLYLGGKITKASGRLMRPWPDLALIRLPSFVVTGLALSVGLGVLLSLMGQSYAALVASGFAAAYLFACMVIGLAIIHYHSRTWPLRAGTLGLTYAALMFVYPWSHFGIAMLAVAEPMLRLQRPPEDTPYRQPDNDR